MHRQAEAYRSLPCPGLWAWKEVESTSLEGVERPCTEKHERWERVVWTQLLPSWGKRVERALLTMAITNQSLVSKGKCQKTWLRSENCFVLGIEGLCLSGASRFCSVCVP